MFTPRPGTNTEGVQSLFLQENWRYRFCGNSPGTFDSGSTTDDPALIIEPDETIEEVSCSKTNVVSANNLRYGVFADWVAGSGTDTFVCLQSGS